MKTPGSFRRLFVGLTIVAASFSSTSVADASSRDPGVMPPPRTASQPSEATRTTASLPRGVKPGSSSILEPLELTPRAYAKAIAAIRNAPLISDDDCMLPPEVVAATVLQVTSKDEETCVGRDKELVVRGSNHGLYVCSQGKIVRTMRVSLGSAGLNKQKEGDRKTPTGTYWLGYPRISDSFGIFIPVGYPNYDDLVAGRTGNSIGIHGPTRFTACLAGAMVTKDWTKGCIAAARDEQIVSLAEWILANWPVRVTITAK